MTPEQIAAAAARPDDGAGTADTPAFELPPELAIDTDVARRIIGEFIREQLRQAGFDKAVLGLSGGIDSALVAYLVAEAIGADKLLTIMMPYKTSSPASQGDAVDADAVQHFRARLAAVLTETDHIHLHARELQRLRLTTRPWVVGVIGV